MFTEMSFFGHVNCSSQWHMFFLFLTSLAWIPTIGMTSTIQPWKPFQWNFAHWIEMNVVPGSTWEWNLCLNQPHFDLGSHGWKPSCSMGSGRKCEKSKKYVSQAIKHNLVWVRVNVVINMRTMKFILVKDKFLRENG